MARKISLHPEALHNSLGGETVVLSLATGESFSLDSTGQRIWQLLQDLGDREAVAKRLVEEYEGDDQDIRHDLDEFLKELESRGLIVIDP